MTDEEFYKNALLEALKLIYKYVPHLQDKNKLEEIFSLSIEDVDSNLCGYSMLNIKRKLILKEKTWYKTKDEEEAIYVAAILPSIFSVKYPVLAINSDGVETPYTLSGCYYESEREHDRNLWRECTPAEVKEIEDKLREQK